MDAQPNLPAAPRSTVRRNLWLFLAAWAVQVIVLEALLLTLTPTTWTATSLLICRASERIYPSGGSAADRRMDLDRYMSTQVDLVSSSDVLGAALVKHPEMATLPSLKGVEDPEAELRRLLNVQIRPNTNLITVSVPSEDPGEAKQIVDNVVEAYLAAAHTWSDEESQEQIARLTKETQRLENDINAKRTKLKNLQNRIGTVEPDDLKDQGRISMERFMKYLDRLDDIRLERIRVESELEVAQMGLGRDSGMVGGGREDPKAVETAFYNDPRVAEVLKARKEAQEQFDAAMRESKGPEDTGVSVAMKKLDAVEAQLKSLWRQLSPGLLEISDEDRAQERTIKELEAKALAARTAQAMLEDQLRRFQVDNSKAGGEMLEIEFLRAECERGIQKLTSLRDRIMQLEYDARGPARVDRANRATRVDPHWSPSIPLLVAMPFVALAIVLPAFPQVLVLLRRRGSQPEAEA